MAGWADEWGETPEDFEEDEILTDEISPEALEEIEALSVPVEDVAGKYSYPSRLETGLERLDPRKISESKRGTYIDNYDFLLTLKKVSQE